MNDDCRGITKTHLALLCYLELPRIGLLGQLANLDLYENAFLSLPLSSS